MIQSIDFAPYDRVNELSCRFLGTAVSLNSWVANDSSSRIQMFTSHVGQMLVIEGSNIPTFLTGTEREYAKYTFSIKFEHDSRVLAVLNKYPQTVGYGGVAHNPLRTVIFEEADTGEIGYLDIVDYHIRHQSYGFRYRHTRYSQQLEPDMVYPAGTTLARSPNVTEHGDYAPGRDVPCVFLSIAQVIEDGIVASDEYCKANTFMAVKDSQFSFGSKSYPLSIHKSRHGEYKFIPDIGEQIGEDGILAAFRDYDEDLAVVEMHTRALRKIDYNFDRLIYAEPGATISDIDVWHDPNARIQRTPKGMDVQARKYFEQISNYYRGIYQQYHKLSRNRGAALNITRPFHRLVVEAQARTTHMTDQARLSLVYRKTPLDDWRFNIQYTYKVVPTIGFKVTGLDGDKGVITDVWPQADMPCDRWGNRAELILDGDSTIKRMNIGRMFRHWFSAAGRHLRLDILALMDAGNYTDAWTLLTNYYKSLSSFHWKQLLTFLENEQRRGRTLEELQREHLDQTIRNSDRIHMVIPTDLPELGAEQYRRLDSWYKLPQGPVRFRGRSGRMVETVNDVLVGNLYFILLEKTGDDWSSVSSPRLQHLGFPAKLTRGDKSSTPGRNQPVRILGEDECRLIAAVCGSFYVAELLDQANSPLTHKHIVRKIQLSDTPSNLEQAVDREEVPYGLQRAVSYVKHILSCAGTWFVG